MSSVAFKKLVGVYLTSSSCFKVALKQLGMFNHITISSLECYSFKLYSAAFIHWMEYPKKKWMIISFLLHCSCSCPTPDLSHFSWFCLCVMNVKYTNRYCNKKKTNCFPFSCSGGNETIPTGLYFNLYYVLFYKILELAYTPTRNSPTHQGMTQNLSSHFAFESVFQSFHPLFMKRNMDKMW